MEAAKIDAALARFLPGNELQPMYDATTVMIAAKKVLLDDARTLASRL